MRNLIKPVLLLKKHSCFLQNQIKFQALKRLAAAQGEVWISSDGDDQMGQKSKPKNPYSFQQNSKKSLDQQLTPPKNPRQNKRKEIESHLNAT